MCVCVYAAEVNDLPKKTLFERLKEVFFFLIHNYGNKGKLRLALSADNVLALFKKLVFFVFLSAIFFVCDQQS